MITQDHLRLSGITLDHDRPGAATAPLRPERPRAITRTPLTRPG
ncbi:hypothetical protein [Lysobacter gummosus]